MNVDHHQAFPFAIIRHSGDGKYLVIQFRGLVQGLLNLAMGYHLPANLGKSGKPVGDLQESIFVDQGNVSRDIPALSKDALGQIVSPQIAFHDIGASHDEHPLVVG